MPRAPAIQPADTATADLATGTGITGGFSLEITAKDVASLRAAAPGIPPGTRVAVTFLPGEQSEARIAAARAVRELGFEPVPHFSARRFASAAKFEAYLGQVTGEAGARYAFVIAGDAQQGGPFADSAALIATGAFERAGIAAVGIAGHPEGHPHMSEAQCWRVLAEKCAAISGRGMTPFIVTQFGFDAGAFLSWLEDLRMRGISAPVRIGVPGPAGISTLVRFAARCGVGASASVLAKYGISITRLIGTAGPGRLIESLATRLEPRHGAVKLHFYPFGGLAKTVEWIAAFRQNQP